MSRPKKLWGLLLLCVVVIVLLVMIISPGKDKSTSRSMPVDDESDLELPKMQFAPDAAPPTGEGDGGGSYSFEEKQRPPEDKPGE